MAARLVANGVDVHGELDEAVGVAPLVVVPRDELDEGLVEADASLEAKQRRVSGGGLASNQRRIN